MQVFGKIKKKIEIFDVFISVVSSIYVDAVINHMAAGGNRGSAG
jgi:hypothetical protein